MRLVYDFDEHCEAGRALLGGKGVGLAEMTQLGLPVPKGFTVTTEACRAELPPSLLGEVDLHLARLEALTGKRFGDPSRPLLVSVRSGGPISMPGMMETVLNLGLNRSITEALALATGSVDFAFDAYRRLIQMYGEVVAGIEHEAFVPADSAIATARAFEDVYRAHTGVPFPEDPRDQLAAAIRGVFASWNAPRAVVYRHQYGISDALGTAVNIVEMVFGNRDDRSATGVCFSRNPATGEPGLYGEFLVRAQGEDIVAGTRTPEAVGAMADAFPESYAALEDAVHELEQHYRDMQDVEFTIEQDRLFLLQTRSAKRTAAAALRCAVAFVDDGLIDRTEAVRRIEPSSLDQLLHPTFDPSAEIHVAAVGLAASPGAACGVAVFDADRAAGRAAAGEEVILVRPETTADDIHGLIPAEGVLTARGGMTSHAAVVARGMGKPCVAGCAALQVDLPARTAEIGDVAIAEGDVLTIDGTTGRVVVGAVELVEPAPNADLELVLTWADELRRLSVYANADTPLDAERARARGAQGIASAAPSTCSWRRAAFRSSAR